MTDDQYAADDLDATDPLSDPVFGVAAGPSVDGVLEVRLGADPFPSAEARAAEAPPALLEALESEGIDVSRACGACGWVYGGPGFEDAQAANLSVWWHRFQAHGGPRPAEPPVDAGFHADPARGLGRPAATKVAIVGYTSTRRFVPYDRSTRSGGDVALWGINNLHLYDDVPTEKFDRWFDLHHAQDILGANGKRDDRHLAWLASGADGLPFYTFSPDDSWPSGVRFPAEELLEEYSPRAGGRYFTNSVSWMVALAIQEVLWAAPFGEAEIAIFGIDMAVGGDGNAEYAHQRPSCEYWIGLAEGLGIRVHVPEQSDLLKAGALYGFELNPLEPKLNEREAELMGHRQHLESARAQLSAQLEECVANLHANTGALQQVGYFKGVWTTPGNRGASTHESDDIAEANAGPAGSPSGS